MKDRNIKLVFTSPLRRALQTTYELFKDHKNKPRVVVVPGLKEQLGGSCDIADDLNVIRREFLDYDYSLFDTFEDNRLWYISILKDEALKQGLLDEIYRNYPDRDEAVRKAPEILVTRIKELYPEFLENVGDLHRRVSESKQWIYEKSSELNEDEEAVIVAHSFSLKCFIAESMNEDGTFVGYRFFENCKAYDHSM